MDAFQMLRTVNLWTQYLQQLKTKSFCYERSASEKLLLKPCQTQLCVLSLKKHKREYTNMWGRIKSQTIYFQLSLCEVLLIHTLTQPKY